MSLQDTFYVLGIVVMSLSLIILTAAVIVIRNKINRIHEAVENKLSYVTSITDIAKKVTGR